MKMAVIRPNGRGGYSVIIDGVDVSPFVAADGLVIEIRQGRAYLTLPVEPVMFVGEFPEAVVKALEPEPYAASDPVFEGCPDCGHRWQAHPLAGDERSRCDGNEGRCRCRRHREA